MSKHLTSFDIHMLAGLAAEKYHHAQDAELKAWLGRLCEKLDTLNRELQEIKRNPQCYANIAILLDVDEALK
jgi:hypothetical protein